MKRRSYERCNTAGAHSGITAFTGLRRTVAKIRFTFQSPYLSTRNLLCVMKKTLSLVHHSSSMVFGSCYPVIKRNDSSEVYDRESSRETPDVITFAGLNYFIHIENSRPIGFNDKWYSARPANAY
jgi:hypothetical protein